MNRLLIKYLFVYFNIILLLSSCSLNPDYQTPELPVRKDWNIVQTQDQGKLVSQMTWQDFFISLELQNLITKGLANNRDYRKAALNIKVARAQYQIIEYLLPDIDAMAEMREQRTAISNNTARSMKTRQYNFTVGATAFEVDLFGRLGSQKEATLEDYFSTVEAAQTVRIALISEIARSYMTLIANKQQLFLAKQTLDSQQKSYNLIKRRYEAGISSKLDESRANTSLQTTRVDYAQSLKLIAQNHNALELLVGTQIEQHEVKASFKELILGIAKIKSGLPSDLLLNRPDVRQAEHNLRAANANIGAARAAFFPRLTLTGTTGFSSLTLSDLFDQSSRTWLFNPQITMPIFNWGRNQANLDITYLRKDISILEYEKAIQTAFREVADALVARESLEKELRDQLQLVASSKTAQQLAQARYDQGVDNYLTVLDAVRSSYAAEQSLISKYYQKLENFVNLYAALGGGQDELSEQS